MAQGGKRSRPFITLAAYDALKGAAGTRSADGLNLPDARAPHRPGHRGVSQGVARPRRHRGRRHLPLRPGDAAPPVRRRRTAINVGDYLLGLGYRLVGRERKELGGDCTADILNRLADAHLKLSEGQGAELLWRDAKDKTLTALDALKIYALKTAPAFEAALYAGVRLAGPADAYEKTVADFSKNLGVAFQILNDLKDWDGDADNKLTAGQDVLGRPADAAAGPRPGRLRAGRPRRAAGAARTAAARPPTPRRRGAGPPAVRPGRRSSTRPRS